MAVSETSELRRFWRPIMNAISHVAGVTRAMNVRCMN
jgi:hypothetical protein